MPVLATSTFLQVIFGMLIVVPIVILWTAAVFDVFRHGHSGIKVAAILLLILMFPVIGPMVYLAFQPRLLAGPTNAPKAGSRLEATSGSVGGTSLYG